MNAPEECEDRVAEIGRTSFFFFFLEFYFRLFFLFV